jgi:hypothetical protein
MTFLQNTGNRVPVFILYNGRGFQEERQISVGPGLEHLSTRSDGENGTSLVTNNM